jgi:hypothetical protein
MLCRVVLSVMPIDVVFYVIVYTSPFVLFSVIQLTTMYDTIRTSLYAICLRSAILKANKTFGLSVNESQYRVLLVFYLKHDKDLAGWKVLESKLMPMLNLSLRHLGADYVKPLVNHNLLGCIGNRYYVTALGTTYLTLVNRLIKQIGDDYMHQHSKM